VNATQDKNIYDDREFQVRSEYITGFSKRWFYRDEKF
jgi:hypothetical protein